MYCHCSTFQALVPTSCNTFAFFCLSQNVTSFIYLDYSLWTGMADLSNERQNAQTLILISERHFLFHHYVKTGSVWHLTFCNGNGFPFHKYGVQKIKLNHSSPLQADVIKAWSFISIPIPCLRAVSFGVRHSVNFHLLFILHIFILYSANYTGTNIL
jgi:hypothetical protein